MCSSFCACGDEATYFLSTEALIAASCSVSPRVTQSRYSIEGSAKTRGNFHHLPVKYQLAATTPAIVEMRATFLMVSRKYLDLNSNFFGASLALASAQRLTGPESGLSPRAPCEAKLRRERPSRPDRSTAKLDPGSTASSSVTTVATFASAKAALRNCDKTFFSACLARLAPKWSAQPMPGAALLEGRCRSSAGAQRPMRELLEPTQP
mmetsp:Transcript_71525/g.155393  ORF Transcript_71525/g.155393 Transcript_71525/m.155393 type:complete len:208 (-) Transcript_71525:3-626(-)